MEKLTYSKSILLIATSIFLMSFQLEIHIRPGTTIDDLIEDLESTNLTQAHIIEEMICAEKINIPLEFRKFNSVYDLEGILSPGKYCFDSEFVELRGMTQEAYEHNAKAIFTKILNNSNARHSRVSRKDLILSSIIEKEASLTGDFRRVSGVFKNRMRNNYKLGSCVTVEYIQGYHRPFLTLKDVAVESDYNTYLNKGLPPGPICFVSDDALNAAVEDIQSDYLFFVLDWVEEVILFSRDYQTHLLYSEQAKQNYIDKFGARSRYKKIDSFYTSASTSNLPSVCFNF
jgi:peptidoglycan lytic transglycosylase G